jgi:hypothetical protein
VRPARWLPPTSLAATLLSSVSARATIAPFSRSAKGSVVEASMSAAIFPRSSPRPRQSRAAATAMVTTSSSQLASVRVPLPRILGAYHALASAIACLRIRSRGR